MRFGCYQQGYYYSNSFSGIPYELGLWNDKGVGREAEDLPDGGSSPGGWQKTMRIVSLLHETGHLIQDLSLGCCHADILRRQAIRTLLNYLRVTRSQIVNCPVSSRSPLSLDPKLEGALVECLARWEWAGKLDGSSDVEQPDEAAGPAGTLRGVTVPELLEGSVATQTLCGVASRVQGSKDTEYLLLDTDRLFIRPERLPTVYYAARRAFDISLGRGLGLTYQDDQWPLNYPGSARMMSDVAFLILADIALHIPPIFYIEQRLESGLSSIEDFDPTLRYFEAISHFIKKGGFPDSSDAKVFHHLLFDQLADELAGPGSRKPMPPGGSCSTRNAMRESSRQVINSA